MGGREGVTCKYFSVEPLNPVVPHVETDHGLQTIESPHPDLGEKVVGELQVPQARLTPELVPAETSERVPGEVDAGQLGVIVEAGLEFDDLVVRDVQELNIRIEKVGNMAEGAAWDNSGISSSDDGEERNVKTRQDFTRCDIDCR